MTITEAVTNSLTLRRCIRRLEWPPGRALIAASGNHLGLHYIIEGGHTATYAPMADDLMADDWYVTDENEHAATIREVSQHVWADGGSPRYPELQDI